MQRGLVSSSIANGLPPPESQLHTHPAPPSRPLIVPAGCCVASQCAALLLSCRLVVPPLVVSSCQLVVTPSSLVVLLKHRPLVCVACPCAALSSSRRSPSLTPSNAVGRCCRHRTPLPPPPLNAVSIVHRCHSCNPLPPSNANTHLLCPLPLSNADACRRHPPPLMSISMVASSSPIHSPRRCCHRTLSPPLNAPPSATIERRLHCPLPPPPPPRYLNCRPPHCRTFMKKEAAPPPPVIQRQHSDLFNLSTVFEV